MGAALKKQKNENKQTKKLAYFSFDFVSMINCTFIPCLSKPHPYISSLSLSPDLGQQTTHHLLNWPLCKGLNAQYSGPFCFVEKEKYCLQSSFCVSGTLLSGKHLL